MKGLPTMSGQMYSQPTHSRIDGFKLRVKGRVKTKDGVRVRVNISFVRPSHCLSKQTIFFASAWFCGGALPDPPP